MSQENPVSVRETRVRWTPDEFRKIVRQLCKNNPLKYPGSRTMAGLSLAELKAAAQQVLPRDRWRSSMVSLTKVKPRLIQYMDEFRQSSEGKEFQERARHQQTTGETVKLPLGTPPTPAAPPGNVPQTPVEPPPKENVPNTQPLTLADQLPQLADEYMQAFRPILRLLGKELADMLAPIVVKESLPHLRAMIGEMFVPASQAEADEQQLHQRVQLPAGLDVRKQVRPKIAILGGNVRTHHDIRASFPLIDFVFFADGSTGVKEAIQYCDRALLMTDKTNHPMRDAAKKTMGDRLHHVSGGSTNVKHMIHTLIRTGVIAIPSVN